jgi:UDP-N-acetylglucosamine acyltransferase
VHAGAVLGDLPQDLGFQGGDSFLRIGANCMLREGLTIHRGTKPGSATEIGDGCFLMANAHFAHNVKLGNGVIVVSGALLAGYVEVGDRAFISGNAVVHQFVRIGRLAMLGGISGVSKDVPPFFTVRPGAVNRVLGVNIVGLRRAGFKPDERQAIREAFKLLYRSGLNVTDAVARLRGATPAAPVLEICDFIDQSRRGIIGFGGDDEE